MQIRPESGGVPLAGRRLHGGAGVGRAAGRPGDAGGGLRQAGRRRPGFLLESVEHGERWSRFSFVGRDPVATLVLRDGRSRSTAACRVPLTTDRGILAALDELLAAYRAPAIAELPPLHGGLMGYLGYDVIREVERLPTARRTTATCPTR